MKKIISGVSVIAAVVAITSMATYAVFSATSSINGNTVGTANIVFTAQGEANGTTVAKPLTASNLVPGQYTSWARGTLYNHIESSIPVKAYMYVDNVVGGACDKINLRVTTGFAGSDATERARNIYNGALSGITGAGNRVETTGIPPFATIGPNISQVIQQQAQLDPSADSSDMGQSCTWDEVFVAESVAP